MSLFSGRAAWSMGLFGFYVVGLGLALMLIPDTPLALAGLPPAQDVWIRVAGMMIFFMGVTEVIAGATGWTTFIRATVPLRYLVIVTFTSFVAAGFAGPALIGFGVPDALGATWTLWALRADARDRGGADAVAV